MSHIVFLLEAFLFGGICGQTNSPNTIFDDDFKVFKSMDVSEAVTFSDQGQIFFI